MHPTRLAIMLCIFTINFITIALLLDLYAPYAWMLKKLPIDKGFIDDYGMGKIAFEATTGLSILSTSIIIWISTSFLYPYLSPAAQKNNISSQQKIKLVVAWYVFFAIYLIIALLLALCLPEIWLHQLFLGDRYMSCGDPVWDDIHMSLVFTLSLPITGVIVALALKRYRSKVD